MKEMRFLVTQLSKEEAQMLARAVFAFSELKEVLEGASKAHEKSADKGPQDLKDLQLMLGHGPDGFRHVHLAFASAYEAASVYCEKAILKMLTSIESAREVSPENIQ